nr:reverse transcriptase domain-containing protein [Tanacetum cinerariifolium]
MRRKETAAKDKPTTIYMVRSWQRTVKQKITQSFEQGKEITFPPLANSNGTEGPLVIEAEIGGHTIHRMYIDGGSSMKILYENCFNRLRPDIKKQMVPATTSLTRLILTNPDGVEFTYALRFQFAASNNEAEYEALIAGLRIATKIGVKNIQANVDSKLVANQVLGTYVAKEDNMIQYLEIAKGLVSGFKTFSISQVPRSKNKKADALREEDGTKGPVITEAEMGGHCVHRIYVDGGSTSEILYEHCFSKFRPEIINQLVPTNTPVVRFSGEIIWPLGQISLLVRVCDEEHSTSTQMNFMVVRSPSPYNGIIGRPRVRKIQAIPSTTHEMINIPVAGGIVTLQSSRIIPLECSMVSEPGVPRYAINQVREEKIQVAIHPEHPEQTVAIGSTLTEEGRKKLCRLLRRHLDVFAWKPADMTGVPRYIAEHRLNVREGCLPVRKKKRGQAPERNKAISEEVKKLVEADIMKEVHYHS